MLTKIREKSQGAFAGIILTVICVPFILWGINNYLNDGQESPIASVGKKDFYQRDLNKAYEKFQQSLGNFAMDEANLKSQALSKLIKDEVMLQYVNQKGLVVTDQAIRDFVTTLPYFQTDGKFDDEKYKQLLRAQRMSSNQFVGQIKNALVMEQFQQTMLNSSFATPYDVEHFFKIQNQQRDVDYLTIPIHPNLQTPSDEAINQFYQAHQSDYQNPEKISVDYLELTLDELAKTVEVNEEKLSAFYEEQKDQYSLPERRKISHILFAINDKQTEKVALEKVQQAKNRLNSENFSTLAQELSDDHLTAKNGGDLGLFSPNVMDKTFETAALSLKQGEVSAPIKSSFGYHLIKVSELTPSQIKPYNQIKAELTAAYQKSQAENLFTQKGEELTEICYQNTDTLQVAANQLQLTLKTTTLFTKTEGEGIANNEKIRAVAFSDDVLQGNNSTPIEISNDHLIVLRLHEHKNAESKPLETVKKDIIKTIQTQQAQQNAIDTANAIKTKLLAGDSLSTIANDYKLPIQNVTGLTRMKKDFNAVLNAAIFKAAKPIADKPSIFIVALPTHEQIVVSLNKVEDGVLSEEDKAAANVMTKRMAKVIGESEFNSLINTLQEKADVEVHSPRP
jgi:peptidyl-prolyl cis-trans isomerase D